MVRARIHEMFPPEQIDGLNYYPVLIEVVLTTDEIVSIMGLNPKSNDFEVEFSKSDFFGKKEDE